MQCILRTKPRDTLWSRSAPGPRQTSVHAGSQPSYGMTNSDTRRNIGDIIH